MSAQAMTGKERAATSKNFFMRCPLLLQRDGRQG
jgi:hypothetical protein